MQLYFVRHGESEANVHRIVSNRGFQHGLTKKGFAQAQALAEQLKAVPVDLIFSSPLKRAVQTAEILGRDHNLDYTVTDTLREFDCGVMEGKSDAESWVRFDTLIDDWLLHQQWHRRFEGGESFEDIRQRFVPFINNLTAQYADTDKIIVLAGHGGTYRLMLPLVLENVDLTFAYHHWLANTAYVHAEYRTGALVCCSWGEVTFED